MATHDNPLLHVLAPRGTELVWSEQTRRGRLIAAYYEHLNADADFRAALRVLFDTLDTNPVEDEQPIWPPLSDERRPTTRRRPDVQPPLPSAEVARRQQRADLVSAFIARWSLPRNVAVADLDWSHRNRRQHDDALLPAPRMLFSTPAPPGESTTERPVFAEDGTVSWEPLPNEDAPTPDMAPHRGILLEVAHIPATEDETAVQVVQHVPLIRPNLPLPFVYDPRQHDREWLQTRIDDICRDITESVKVQAGEYERQARAAGWRRTPPGWGDPNALQEYARRLYLRAVKGWSWGKIAAETDFKREAIARQTTGLAALLGIPLPAKPTQVRPRPRR